MSWEPKSLGDILNQSGYHRAGDREFPVLSITMKQGLVDQADKFKKRIASADTSNYRVVYKNELVVGFPIDEGVLGFQTKYPAGIVSPAYDIWKLKNENECHIPYLERYLRSPQARRLYASRMQGAVARRRSLTKADFLKLEIPFPPLDDQIRIAYLLGKVEGLIAQRKQHLQQLDDLLKSVFLEMFGDPVRNEKGWELTTIGDLASDVKYGTSASAQGGQYKYLRMNNITQNGYWDFESIKYIDVDDKDFEKYSLWKGDLVFNRTNSKELVGKTAVYDRDEPVVIAGYLIRVRFDHQTNPWFVWGHLNSKFGKTRLFNLCRNIVGMANINAQELKAIPLLKPPIEIQNRFAVIVEKVEALKTGYQQSLSDQEDLYGALSQQAFKGELDLSRIEVPQLSIAEASQESLPAAQEQVLQSIELPELPIELSLFGKGRETALQYWFEAALKGMPIDNAVQAEELINAINFRLMVMDDQDREFDGEDYEVLKRWVFDALAKGKLTQTCDDAGNRIQLKASLE